MSRQQIGNGVVVVLCVEILFGSAWARRVPEGPGREFGRDARHMADMELFHVLLDSATD